MVVITGDCLKLISCKVGENINGRMEDCTEEHGYKIKWKEKESLDGKILVIIRPCLIIIYR